MSVRDTELGSVVSHNADWQNANGEVPQPLTNDPDPAAPDSESVREYLQ